MIDKELTINNCYKILNEYKTPEIVIKHSEAVAKICYFIGEKLIEKGEKVELKTLIPAALLHDIFKIIEIDDYTQEHLKGEKGEKQDKWNELKQRFEGKNHEEAFVLEFDSKYPKISEIVQAHKYLQINDVLKNWEEKLIYYADKIAKFDKITTLKQRLDDAHDRYGHLYGDIVGNEEFVKKTDEKIFLLEKDIFKITGLSPDYLIKLNEVDFKEMIKNG
ncbi:HD domain-containing protein [Candidatus Woesearchaeota archaeon]|nr:HD domain-containing protein [Candidatus Woesearchaeota archaeon]